MKMYSWCSRCGIKRAFLREKVEREKEEMLIKNGSLLLEFQIKFCDRKYNPFRIFSEEELKRATNRHNKGQVFRKDWCHHLYKGEYEERSVSVKKFNECMISTEYNIYEVVLASQMRNHKNALKLLGCCLETKFPTLVYEFTGERTLKDYIFDKEGQGLFEFSWENKLRIAAEIADVITYMHIARSRPIVHRDITSCNILLDENYVAKLHGFTFSLPIPLDKTHIEAEVVGTFGFIDPESESTGRFTVKSDVYGFGAVLLEILTGEHVFDILNPYRRKINVDCSESSNNVANKEFHVLSRYEVIEQYLRAKIFREGNIEQYLKSCGELALKCLKENPEERPVMKEVSQELRRIRKINLKADSTTPMTYSSAARKASS